jgi:acylphosphatase
MATRIRIEGRVQGVGFRAWTARSAAELGLDGWVRNRRDGTVEALLAGDADTVRRMVSACRKGPPMAQVTRLTEEEADAPQGRGFRTLPTE